MDGGGEGTEEGFDRPGLDDVAEDDGPGASDRRGLSSQELMRVAASLPRSFTASCRLLRAGREEV